MEMEMKRRKKRPEGGHEKAANELGREENEQNQMKRKMKMKMKMKMKSRN